MTWRLFPLICLVLAASGPAAAHPFHPWPGACAGPRAYRAAALANAASLETLAFSPFGRPETGWALYAPRIAEEIHTDCAPPTPGFARALAHWQARHATPGDGVLDPAGFEALKTAWQARRPFVALRAVGVCPDAPDLSSLSALGPEESDGGKVILLRPRALAALRRMIADTRRAVPEAAADPERLSVFSGYRDPADDAARCEAEANCNGTVRAQCSAHRTGLAVDLFMGAAPGFGADSSADANRRFQTESATYRWLIAHAARYGFVNYGFEPWHWEWTGEAP